MSSRVPPGGRSTLNLASTTTGPTSASAMRRQSNPILGNSEPVQKVVGKRRSENSNATFASPAATPETPQKFSIRTFPKAASASTHSRIFESTPVSPPSSRFRRESAPATTSGTPAAGVASTTPTTTGRKRVQQPATISEAITPPKTPTPKPTQLPTPLKSRHLDQTTATKEPTAPHRPHLKPQPESNAHQWKSSILLGDDSPVTPSFGPTKISYLPKRRTALQKETPGSVKLAELTGFQDAAVLISKKEAGKLDPASVGLAAGKSGSKKLGQR
ncbi:hypothetical protein BJ741DRAFT_629098 [Chytriomyces cf. hyalinus JEL632]|nr:hypothetical protein BJ741DRAFT_629098 [Chytriomyces cf. hyalinus JEL632]